MPLNLFGHIKKEQLYHMLSDIYAQVKDQGPTMIVGDFNARVGKPMGKDEESIAGIYTFLSAQKGPSREQPKVKENRELFMEYHHKHAI